jgi:uncharacterized Zn finger protein
MSQPHPSSPSGDPAAGSTSLYHCEQCGAVFQSLETLRDHKQTVHGEGGESLNETIHVPSDDDSSEGLPTIGV